ncbi:MAG: chromosome segregation protein SMC [Bryobacteraceae bacterium]|nr:chromosome segregation protein SMC [Bryobacteraceae bacterium]
MLKLKRVELHGFKSFCDRTEMRFNGAGLTAVVGPNGCGKSNLSDAISWVLGEQSAKTLRGSRMMDVIFAGTNNRKPLGMASVTMTLADPSHHHEHSARRREAEIQPANGHAHPSPANGSNGFRLPKEVTITRRLYRSGESEYLIDGRAARLRDIQDLFMGTGLGPESYAIIEQGRIGQILSSKPQDRRAMIEEAAGISKFKARKRLAEAKLEGARQNLSRVFDILEEVGRQVNSLKRQASKARRYQELHAEMVVELRRMLTGRFLKLEREAAKTALDLNLANAEFQKLAGEIAADEQQHAATQSQAYQTEAELTRTRGRLAELRVESERTRGRLESQARQIGEIDRRLAAGEADAQSLEGRITELTAQLEAHASLLGELDRQAAEARESLAAKTAERESAQEQLRRGEQGIEAARQGVLRLLGEAASLRNELAQIDEYLASIDRDSARAEKEEQFAQAELDRLEVSREELDGWLSVERTGLESLLDERRNVEEELASARSNLLAARARLDELRSVTTTLRARKNSLDEILSHRAYTTESVKRFFTALDQGPRGELAPLGVLADFVDVDRTYEKAAEEFLHEELEYIVVKDWNQADKGIDLMRRDVDGRATFLIHPEPDAPMPPKAQEPPLGPETGIVTRLSSVLRMTNGLTHAPAELLPRLARCMIAENREAAQRLAQQYPDFYFLLPDGVCYHGYAVSGGRKSASGPLALKRELRELTAALQKRQQELDEAAALVSGLDCEIAVLGAELERLRSAQQAKEKQVLALDHDHRKLDEEISRMTSRLSVARMELERLRREKENGAAQRERNRALVEEKERARAEHERQLEGARARIQELQAEAARLSEEHSALRVELAGHEERRRAEGAAQSRLAAQRNELTSRRDDLGREMERLGIERARLLADNIELDDRSAALAAEIAGVERAVSELESAETALREQLAALDESLKNRRTEAQAAQERRAQIEVALAERRAELRYLDETSRKELNVGCEELARSEGAELDEVALADSEEKYAHLKNRIEALGPVNPQALEEFQEAQQRYDFLNAQRQDLLDSIRDTEKAIHDIDQETRKRFSHAFEAINDNFRQMFRTLFNGGMGEMRLTDETNAAESGIDVVASPPGKRLQNVLLLSGGEKALTALALLMAIFQYQPSPFCILDEVDAPLDEPNIQRLLRLIKEMSVQTQFIIITHAKTTMAAAESLYGVTMQEPGVSKLVSVRFQPASDEPPERELVHVHA